MTSNPYHLTTKGLVVGHILAHGPQAPSMLHELFFHETQADIEKAINDALADGCLIKQADGKLEVGEF